MLEKSTDFSARDSAPLMHDTTLWERLSEFRSKDQVRLVTLWAAGGSSVSLQAGSRGAPSLQWTSRMTSHGEAAHGVLDQLLATSLTGAARGLRGGANARGDAANKKLRPMEAAGAATGVK